MSYALRNLRQANYRFFLLNLLFMSSLTHADTWVISDRSKPVTAPPNTRIILLDDQQHLEELLSQALPEAPAQAAAIIQDYLSSPIGKRLQADLVRAQQGITDAWSLGIEKIPAVVVDRRYVIYGETDVAKAVERIKQTRGSSQ